MFRILAANPLLNAFPRRRGLTCRIRHALGDLPNGTSQLPRFEIGSSLQQRWSPVRATVVGSGLRLRPVLPLLCGHLHLLPFFLPLVE